MSRWQTHWHIPAIDLEPAPLLCGLGYRPIWPLSCHSAGVRPTCALGDRPTNLGLGYKPWNGSWPSSSSYCCQSCPPRDWAGDTSICAAKIGPLTSFWLQILKWPWNLTTGPSFHSLGVDLPSQGLQGDTSICALPGGRPADSRAWSGPVTWIQSWFSRSPAHTGKNTSFIPKGRLVDLGLTLDPETALWPSSSPAQLQCRGSFATRNLAGSVFLHACWRQTCSHWFQLWTLWLSSSSYQLQSKANSVHPEKCPVSCQESSKGTQWEPHSSIHLVTDLPSMDPEANSPPSSSPTDWGLGCSPIYLGTT